MPPGAVQEQFYQARKKLGDVARELPAGAIGPFVNDEYSDVTFALYALQALGLPPRELVREAETIRQRLLRVPGVKKVDIIGERPERIFVDISYRRLATLGVSAPQLFEALAKQNAVAPAGSVDTGGARVFVRVDGAIAGVEAVRTVPIAAGGKLLWLGDVADVRRGYEDPPSFLVRHDGAPALVLSVIMQDRWNGLALGRALAAEERALATELPAGITLARISDQARNISEAVDEFMVKFFVALVVVIVISLAALGLRAGVVVAAAVPLTLGAVFIIMLATGRVFDRITLGALILSLGLLVDDAIIAVEMMVVKMQEGLDRAAAAAFAWTATAAPMLTGTLVTIAGLLPVGFAQSTAGEYAGNIFWVVAFALTPKDAADQLQTYLSGAPVTQVREGIRAVELDVRAVAAERRGLGALGDLTLATRDGRRVPLAQAGRLVPGFEDPVLRRRNREPAITVRGDIAEGMLPPTVTALLLPRLAGIKTGLPPGYRIETAGSVEESAKATGALVRVFPVMVLMMLGIIMVQVRSFTGMVMVFVTAPLGLCGAVPALLVFHQPFGFNAILGLIGLAGILMRNTLILTEQIKADQAAGQSNYDAVIEATVRRARPVVLTALAAMLAFVPLTFSSFWARSPTR